MQVGGDASKSDQDTVVRKECMRRRVCLSEERLLVVLKMTDGGGQSPFLFPFQAGNVRVDILQVIRLVNH